MLQRLLLVILASTPCLASASDSPPFCANQPRTRAQQVTCASPELWPLVKKEADAEKWARSQVGNPSIDNIESGEIAWRDANCRDVACLKEWYETQIDFLPKFVSDKKANLATSPRLKENLAAYDARFADLREQVMLAYVAQGCFLRSQAWFRSIGEAYNLTRIHYENEAKFTPYEHSTANSHDSAIDARVLTEHPFTSAATCNSLRNSPTMDRLDALQRQATGGYH